MKAWSVLDGQGENTIIYIKNDDKTVVAVCGFESSTMDSFVLKNVKRFTLYGMDTCDKIEKPTPACDAKTETEPAKEEKKEETKTTEPTSEDYILKTQIVPPVCPSPRPASIGTFSPHAAKAGASISDILSPTPPVLCLSTTRVLFCQVIIAPDSIIPLVNTVVSSTDMPLL